MANRVTDEQLRAVVGAAADEVVTFYIDDANLLVNETLVGHGLSEDRLTVIEKYLAAHLYVLTVERGGLTKDKVGESEQGYVDFTGKGIASTRFGSLAISLDTSGQLALIVAEPKRYAQLRVVASTSSQEPIDRWPNG